MATKRRATTDDEPPASTLEGLVPPIGTVDPFVIGPASPSGSTGWLMGIGTRPETAAEHAVRLDADAGEFNDIGYTLGTLEPRPEWPRQPAEPEPLLPR
jgi:hypothetical protein